jgi:FMN phosphatase YigB (HAD superfamily)
MIKAIIFDWGRTLYDPDASGLYVDANCVIGTLAARYQLAIVALATDGNFRRRFEALERCGVKQYFAPILFDTTNKDDLYEAALAELGLPPSAVAVVDDRVVRGVRWANRRGAMSIWLRRGKFAEEFPNIETGSPRHTITSLSELSRIL